MKKKFLLTIIPALMVLSACAGSGPKVEDNLYLEDTLAHEEIFGGVAEEAGELKLMNPRREGEIAKPATPVVGVQWKSLEEGKYAIRYVAAIESKAVTAVWTRNICQANGNRRKAGEGDSNQVTCQKAYTALSASGGVEVPGTVPSASGESYKYFVVYTLRNIPEADLNSYLFAYLTLTNEGGSSKSLARISKVSGNNSFTIDTDSVNGYFAQGSIKGSSAPVMIDGTPTDGNMAQKEDLQLNANDSFGLFKYQSGDNEHFQFFGYEQYKRGIQFIQKVSANDYVKVLGEGTYKLYLKDNHIYLVVPDAGKGSSTLYFKPNDNWKDSDARFAVYVFENDQTNAWFSMTEIKDSDNNGTGLFVANGIDAATYPNCIFVRMNPASTENNWSNKWTQTGNLVIDNNDGNQFVLDAAATVWEDGWGGWSVYVA